MSQPRLALFALTLAAAVAPAPATAGKALPFVSDDYSSALAQARERQLPLFVEAWAPW